MIARSAVLPDAPPKNWLTTPSLYVCTNVRTLVAGLRENTVTALLENAAT